MAQLASLENNLSFPPRNDKVRGRWAPFYIEPMVGSGERITIGVAVANSGSFVVVPVASLNRLHCLYGNENEALLFAATAALESIREMLVKSGPEGLDNWSSPFEGVYKGEVRLGAGSSLENIARTALTLCSSLVEKLADNEEIEEPRSTISDTRLERLIKEKVISVRPNLEIAFGRSFQADLKARSSKIGFVGQRLVANFSLLVPSQLSRQVKDAKAKLWDLAQVQEYVHAKEFNLSGDLNQFELLVHTVRKDDPQYSERQIEQIREVEHELEMEADRKQIRSRPLHSPDDIAKIILDAEAA